MTTADLKVGTKITDVRWNTTYYITSITEKRVNMDNFIKSYSSTGRGSSKFYVGHKAFNENLKNGNYKIID